MFDIEINQQSVQIIGQVLVECTMNRDVHQLYDTVSVVKTHHCTILSTRKMLNFDCESSTTS